MQQHGLRSKRYSTIPRRGSTIGDGGDTTISSPGRSLKQPLQGMILHDPLHGQQACPELIAFDQGVGQICIRWGLLSCRFLPKRRKICYIPAPPPIVELVLAYYKWRHFLAAAVVYVARPDTSSGDALPPLKISPSSIPSSPHMTLTALYLRHGKKRCAFGAAAVLTADAKIIADEMRPGTVTSAPITEDLPRLLKVTVVGSLTRQTSPQPRLNLSRPRAPLALPQPSRLLLPCVMALRSRVTPT